MSPLDETQYKAQLHRQQATRASAAPAGDKKQPSQSSTGQGDTTTRSQPPRARTARKNPSRVLFEEYKGRTLGVPEWVRVVIQKALAEKRASASGKTR